MQRTAVKLPGSRRVVQLFRWLRRSAAVVIACASAIILGYAAGVFVADINDSNASAPPPARNPIIDTVVTPSRSSFPWLAILVPVAFVALIALFRNRRPVRWLLHRAKAAAETYALPLAPELSATVVVNPAARSTADAAVDRPSVGVPATDAFSPLVNIAARSVASQPVAADVQVTAASDDASVLDLADGCIICVLTFRDEPPVGQASKRTMTVARGVVASRAAIGLAFSDADETAFTRADDRPVASRQIVDVISVFAVNQESVETAQEASAELGRLIEHDHGFRLLVVNTRPGRVTAESDRDPVADDGVPSAFFTTSATQVDLHGLVPLAVYARVDLPAVKPAATPIEPVVVAASGEPAVAVEPVVSVEPVVTVEPELPVIAAVPLAAIAEVVPAPVPVEPVPVKPVPVALVAMSLDAADERKICTMFDMLNELLAMGDVAQQSDQLASSR